MEFKDYYKVMGVARDATEAQIKQAYRKLARKYHPDVSKEKDAEAHFKEVGEAYEVLRSPEKRAAYDQLGSEWKSGEQFRPPPDWGSGYEFSGRPDGARRRRRANPQGAPPGADGGFAFNSAFVYYSATVGDEFWKFVFDASSDREED